MARTIQEKLQRIRRRATNQNLTPEQRKRARQRARSLRSNGQAETPLTPEEQQAQEIQDLLGENTTGAAALAEYFYPEGSMGRVDETRAEEIAQDLDRYRGMADYYGPGGQRRSKEQSDYLNRLQEQSKGFTPQEMRAMRERQNRGLQGAFSTGAAELARAQARGGVRGGASSAQAAKLARDRIMGQATMEADLHNQDIVEKRNRLAAYGQALGGQESAEYDRMMQTQGAYSSALGGARADELARRTYNLGQIAAEKAGQTGTYFGALDYGATRRAADETARQNRRMYRLARKAYGNRGSSGSDSSAPNYDEYYDQVAQTIEGAY